MDIDLSDLSLMQLSDSFFPTGLYTMSNGLETLFDEKRLTSEDDIEDFISSLIINQLGPADCIAFSNAYDFASSRDIEKIISADRMLYSMKLVKEVRDATCRSGSQMLKCIKVLVRDNDILKEYSSAVENSETPATHPIVTAISCNIMGIEKKRGIMLMLYGFSTSMVGASLRLGLIDHLQSQKIIHKLKPLVKKTAEDNIIKKLNEMWQFVPESDVIQILHEQKFSKMFIT